MPIRRSLLARAEALGPGRLRVLRELWWTARLFVYVTPGPELAERAVAGFPDEVRTLATRCPIVRTNARYGGGFYPDRNEIELAAGVETYEGLRQVELSACHELFHYVCRNDARYRADEDQGFPYLRRAVRDSRGELPAYPRYRGWVAGSFLRQGDHANPAEYFADIPTNFREPADLPPPVRAHFAPLIAGSAPPYDMSAPPDWATDDSFYSLSTFQRWLAGGE